jgi:hypothetical protein
VVFNHGGRQLDGAPSSISALPKVIDAVGGKVEILFDGCIRSGQDGLACSSTERAPLRQVLGAGLEIIPDRNGRHAIG